MIINLSIDQETLESIADSEDVFINFVQKIDNKIEIEISIRDAENTMLGSII